MEFGWGFIALFFVIFWGCGRMCGWGRRHRDRERERPVDDSDRRLANLESRVRGLGRGARDGLIAPAGYRRQGDGEREPALMQRKRSSPLEELQQKFVEGRLSMAEYEKELDRLERLE